METDLCYGTSVIPEVSGDDAGFITAQEDPRKPSIPSDDTESKL